MAQIKLSKSTKVLLIIDAVILVSFVWDIYKFLGALLFVIVTNASYFVIKFIFGYFCRYSDGDDIEL